MSWKWSAMYYHPPAFLKFICILQVFGVCVWPPAHTYNSETESYSEEFITSLERPCPLGINEYLYSYAIVTKS